MHVLLSLRLSRGIAGGSCSDLLVADLNSTVPSAASDGIELEVLLECAAGR